MAKITDTLKLMAFLGGVAGGISAATCGTTAWGSRLVRQIPRQKPITGMLVGGVFGFSATAFSVFLDEETKLSDQDKMFWIGSIAIGILTATTLSPIISSKLGWKITVQETFCYECLSALALGIIIYNLE